ncbi:MAG: diphosphomevalonate decarboxylase, partial [Woeseiaceae bacterium]
MRKTARAQPNIALIKYWGKRDVARNLPATGSISATLADLYTDMTVEFDSTLESDTLTVNGAPGGDMLARISTCLDNVAGADRPRARIDSACNFPVAAGLASSASAFAATVVAASAALGGDRHANELASLAGRASGSAARSLYGGFAELRNAGDDIVVETILPANDWPLRVVIAITESEPKDVSSGEAMEISRTSSPFYARWVDEQEQDLSIVRTALAKRDFKRLGEIAEHNCLKMHSVMWTSRPPT